MIPEIGGKPKQWAEEGGGGNGWGGWWIGLAMMRELRQWWVSFGGGGEEVDESVRVCGWGWWESVKLKPLWRMIVWALWELRAWEEKKEKKQKERDEILFYVMACGLQGSRKGSEVGSSREIRPYGLTVYNTNCVHCNTVVVTNWPMK